MLLWCWGCGPNAAAPESRLRINPPQILLAQQTTGSFTVTPSTIDVTWSVLEGESGGSISDEGAYAAPAHSGKFHVVAQSKSDPQNTAAATVTVLPAVVIEPSSISVLPGSVLR